MIGILLCAVLLTHVHTLDTQRWVYKYSVNIYYMQNTDFVFNNCVSFLTIYFVLSILSVQSLLYSKLSEKAAHFFVFIFYCIYFLSYFFACYINIHVHVYTSYTCTTFIFVSMSCFPFFCIICYILFEHFLCHANNFTHTPDFAIYLEANISFDCSPFFSCSVYHKIDNG